MSLLRERAIADSRESTLSDFRPAAARDWLVRLTSFDSDAELKVLSLQARVERGVASSADRRQRERHEGQDGEPPRIGEERAEVEVWAAGGADGHQRSGLVRSFGWGVRRASTLGRAGGANRDAMVPDAPGTGTSRHSATWRITPEWSAPCLTARVRT